MMRGKELNHFERVICASFAVVGVLYFFSVGFVLDTTILIRVREASALHRRFLH